ncbi:MAG: SDR family oxidoreductase, partial [Spirochaetes bacterium]|nr:SDR family oxidoreductase [Spirochaetota bacterium]
VKQAEMFGMIRETFRISAEETIAIKDFPTLNHVVQFVKDKSPIKFESAPAQAAEPAQTVVQPAVHVPESSKGELDDIQKKIIAIVEEKTGYPEDLIEFDLDMESDLGIDTVKQAEMLGIIREVFKIPNDENIVIKDFPTLNHVVEFIRSKSPEYSASASAAAPVKQTEEPKLAPEVVTEESKIKRMTLEMINEELAKDAKEKYDVKGFNILITDDGRGVAAALKKILTDSEANVEIIDPAKMLDVKSLEKELERVKKAGKINGIIHLTSIEESADISDMKFEDWKTNVFKRVKSLFFIAKSLQNDINDNAGKSFITSVTDMGGTFGIEGLKANNPIGGGVTGLTKSLKKEFDDKHQDVRVKSIDIEFKGKPATIAKTIWNEIQLGGERVEVGYSGKDRKVPQVIYKDIDFDSVPRKTFKEDDVFVITGGGYGITSAIAKDIAKNLKGRFALISLESLPSNVAELAALDENGLKELKDKVIAELKANNERVTPVMIDKEYSKYTVAIDIYRNVQEMKALGAVDVDYYSCNVMDNKALTGTINKIKEKFGRIDAIIHGAGINKDKFLADKDFEDFSRIVDVKVDGCFTLIESVKNENLKAFVTFASIAGRFGNIGQTDYAAANDMLNKYVQYARNRFKGIAAASMNWSGWKDVGMATRASITKIFEESGIDMISMQEGVTKVREELLYGDDAEILIAGNVGYIDIDKIIVGYRTKEFVQREELINSCKEKYPMADSIETFIPGKKIAVRKKLDTETDVYLKDHAVDNVPYLPAVMGIESFAETSSLLFPDKKIKQMRDISFSIPVKIFKGKPVNLIISAEKVEENKDEIILKTRLESEFFNKDGVKLGDNKVHFEATVVLGNSFSNDKLKADEYNLDILKKFKENKKIVINQDEIYKRLFHGPMYQVHGGVINLSDKKVYGVAVAKNGKTESHFSFIKKADYSADPLAIEAAFQNAGLLTLAKMEKMALPDGIKELVFKPIPASAKELYVAAEYVGSDDMKYEYNTAVIDGEGKVYSVMKGYKMITTGDLTEDEKF